MQHSQNHPVVTTGRLAITLCGPSSSSHDSQLTWQFMSESAVFEKKRLRVVILMIICPCGNRKWIVLSTKHSKNLCWRWGFGIRDTQSAKIRESTPQGPPAMDRLQSFRANHVTPTHCSRVMLPTLLNHGSIMPGPVQNSME